MKNRKVVCALLALFTMVSASFAVEVDEEEIKSISADEVVFENYMGPHSVINTIEEIRAIGSGIGEVVAKNADKAGTFGYAPKYSVIHAVDAEESGKLDADILVLGPNAAVDHIKNLRRIISAYLTAAYGYSNADADTVATFVTVYNAVYRGNLDMFQKKYKKVVTDNLTKDKVGIALSYRDWPGKTQLVIPLYDINGGLSTVDTSVISDKEVIESMKEDDDKGIEERKGMVDLKEREADNAAERAAEAQKKADEERKKAEEARKAAEEARLKEEKAKAEAEAAKKAAEEAAKKAAEEPKNEQAQQEAREATARADEKQLEAAQAQAEAEQAEQVAEQQEQAAEETQKQADTAQNTAEQKRTEAQEERTNIAKDQQEVIQKQEKNESAPNVYGLAAKDLTGQMSSIVRMNGNDGTLIKESPVTVIRSRTMYEDGNNFIAIAGEMAGNGTVKLVQLDKENMEIVKESNETIYENSVLVQEGGSYYCIIQDGLNCNVGKFDGQLNNQLKSPVNVRPNTPITVTEAGIIVTSITGNPILLNKTDLTQISSKSRYDSMADQVIGTLDAK
ncbi:MAG: hypothetical protein IJP62_08560 [Treponema sp.]|nr:hypothetical protein [Treponema sp.]